MVAAPARWAFPHIALLAVCGLFALRPAARGGPEDLPRDVQDRVKSAVPKGVAFLKEKQLPSGTWSSTPTEGHEVGYAALPGLTLLACGVPADDARVQSAARFVRSRQAKLDNTYEVGLSVLFLDRLGDRKDAALIQRLALRLIGAQTPTGGWGYRVPILSRLHESQLLKVLRLKKKQFRRTVLPPALQNLPVLQDPAALPTRDPPGRNSEPIWGTTDNSCSQFAMLALWAARRHGVPVERTLALVVRRFQFSQAPTGGWGYAHAPGGAGGESPQMTCVGLLGLALGYRSTNQRPSLANACLLSAAQATADLLATGVSSRLEAPVLTHRVWVAYQAMNGEFAQDQRLLAGFRFLNNHIGAPALRLTDLPMPNLYFLWSVERAAVLYGLKKLDGKDWYHWGTEMLLANQQGDGHWEKSGYPGSSPTLDTCLALLFLKRINLSRDLAAKLPFNPKDLAKGLEKPVQKAPTPPVPLKPIKKAEQPPGPAPEVKPQPPAPETKLPTSTSPAPAPAPTPAKSEPAPPAEDHGGTNVWAFVIGGAGLVFLLGGGVFLFAFLRQGPAEDPADRPRKRKRRPERNGRHDEEEDRPRVRKKVRRRPVDDD
jgi:hypothetical protein